MNCFKLLTLLLAGAFALPQAFAHSEEAPGMHWAAIRAADKKVRTSLETNGFSIESVVEDMSYGYAPVEILDTLVLQGFDVVTHFPVSEFQASDFPAKDGIYHNYEEMKLALETLAKANPGYVHLLSMGKTLEGREILGVRLNGTVVSGTEASSLPGIIFMGGHHAREHLSVETPLKLAQHLAKSYAENDVVRGILANRDVYIFPSINPDGSEFDIASGNYKSWRKNRR